MKKWTKLMAVALSLVVIASAIAGGIVLADEPADGQITPPPMQRGGMQHGANVLPELLGLTAEEIHDQRLAGASLAEIAAAQGVSEAELVAALTDGINERLAQAVTDGKLTQAEADEIAASALTRTTEMVNDASVPEPRERQPRERQTSPFQKGFQKGFQAGMQTAELADLLGLTAEEIHDQRLAGASLVEIAAAQGVSEAELVAALTDGITEKMAQAVTDGKLTQEEADEIIAKHLARTTEMVNNTETGQPRMQPRFGKGQADGETGQPRFGGGARGGSFGGNVPRGVTA
jgi:uncharacterized protein YidB (DUF937 family)